MLLRPLYYLLKPALPRGLRMWLRRALAKRLRRRVTQFWPINSSAGKPPEEWPGWPDGKKFAFVLTHDVEGKEGLDRCRQLAEVDVGMGFRASFNFVPEGEYETPRDLRDFLTARGFEVGVQDLQHDGRLYSSRQMFLARAQRINGYLKEWGAVGFRSGFMLHNLDWIRDLQVLYDSSTFDTDPFEPQPDGVNTIFPFTVKREDGSHYVELPYTLPQDSTLFLLFREATIEIWKRKLDWVAEHGGMALLNVHPDYMNFNDRKGFGYDVRLYREFLEYVDRQYGKQCWRARPCDVARYVSQCTIPEPEHGVAQSAPSPLDLGSGDLHPPAPGYWRLRTKRAAMVTFSSYPGDPRPRRAADALIQEGMTLDLVCLAGNERAPRREMVNGIDVVRIPIAHRRGGPLAYAYTYSAFILISSLILAWRTLTRGYDVVYIHNMPDVLVLSALIPKLFGAKVVLDLHDPMPELMMTIFRRLPDSLPVRILQRLEKWSIARADVVITVNLACKKIFGSRSCPPKKVNVVMNSPDGQIFRFQAAHCNGSSHRNPEKPFVIMYHGSLVERNGVDLAVEALARIRQSVPTAQLKIYGSTTPFLERVLDAVREKGLQDSVHHLGPRRLEDIARAIEECDVGVIPNQRNVFTELNTPTRIFEYLALGKPVIAPRAPGIQDYFGEESILSFELGNSEELAKQIEYVFFHPVEATEIAKRGQQVYLAHTWPRQRQVLLGAVARLLTPEVTTI